MWIKCSAALSNFSLVSLIFFFLHSFMNFLFLIIPGHVETLVFDVLKVEWSVAVASLPSSITTNKVSHIDFVLWIIKYCKSF